MFQRLFSFLFIFSLISFSPLFAQDDLIKEIDALNDNPDAGSGPDRSAPSSGSSNIEDLPVDDTPRDEPAVATEDNILQGPLSGEIDNSQANITDMNFRQLSDRVRLVVNSTRAPDFKRELRKQRRQVVLELSNAKLAKTFLKRALDTGEFEGPVALVQAFDTKAGQDNNVKLLFQLRDLIEPTISRSGNNLLIDFPMVLKDGVIFRTRNAEAPKPELFLTINDTSAFKGSRINLNVKDAPLPDVLNFLSKASGQNFVLAEGSGTKVTLNVKNIPWDQVLAIILVNAELGYQRVGNTYRIAKISSLKTELEDAAKSADNEKKLQPIETRLFTLSYLSAKDARGSIEKLLRDTSRENATIDERTNSLVVTGFSENVERISRFLNSVDRQTPQVQIDARIVETSDKLDRKIQWNLSAEGMNLKKIGVQRITTGTNPPSPNLNTQGIWGKSPNLDDIDMLISANDTDTKTKVIAAPRVVVANNQEANLFQGSEVLVLVPDKEGTNTTKTYDYTLDLKVTPQVTNDGYVLLNLNLKRDTPNTQISAEQAKDRRGIVTKMLVKSGETSVIGGLYIDDNSSTRSGIPFFKDLPIIGVLFENQANKLKERRELLMFLSPKILNEEAALVRASANSIPAKDL